jgi:hypothetical protein
MEIRKYIFFVLLFSLAFSLNGQFEIKTNALGLVNNNYNGQVELLLNDKSGVELEVSYRNTPWIIGLSGSEIKNSAFRALVSYKYYIGGEDPTSGLYFGPYVRLKVAGLENIPTVIDETYMGQLTAPGPVKIFNNAFTIGLTAGQKITFNNNFILEYYAGLGYNPYNQITLRDDLAAEIEDFVQIETNSFTWPWDFRLGVSLGYRFWR